LPPRPRRSCASACRCPHRARSLTSSTSASSEWTSGGHGLLGAMPRSYQVTPEHPRPPTSDTAKGGQAQRADSLKESQLAAGCQGSREFLRCDHGNSPPAGRAVRAGRRALMASRWRRMR
jgi:hypothetical protein